MRTATLAACGLVWGATVVAGFGALARYAGTPGEARAPASGWPSGTTARRVEGRPTLVIFLHPRCPCSRASVSELRRILDRARDAVAVAFLVRPPGVAPGWEEGPLLRSASSIPGLEVLRDEAGVEAARFGAGTSGHVALYDRGGRLVFMGGITGARGHEGDNVGRRAVEALLRGDAGPAATPVFGCPLLVERGEGAS